MPTQITNQEMLDRGSSGNFLVAIAQMLDEDANGFGYIMRQLAEPQFVLRDSLPSQAAHQEDNPGLITAVLDEAGAVELTIIHVGAPAVGEVLIQYNLGGSDPGVPTLTFNANVTGYQVLKIEMPKALADRLAATGA